MSYRALLSVIGNATHYYEVPTDNITLSIKGISGNHLISCNFNDSAVPTRSVGS